MGATKRVVSVRDGSRYTESYVVCFHLPRHFCGECVPDGDAILAADRGAARLLRGNADGDHV